MSHIYDGQELLPKPPMLHHWSCGQENVGTKSTFYFSLIHDVTGEVKGSGRIALDLYGAAGVQERARAIIAGKES